MTVKMTNREISHRKDDASSSSATPRDRNRSTPAGSPAPSVSDSRAAPSHATSYATSTTATTNLFDMLRNTFNYDNAEDISDDGESDNGEKAAVARRSPRTRRKARSLPPSMTPRTPRRTPGMMSPSMIVRGTPGRTPCSSGG